MLRFPLDFLLYFISLFWGSPTYLDCTHFVVVVVVVGRCYSAQVTAISIYFCTLFLPPRHSLSFSKEMHTQLLLFLHTFTALHKHMHARTHEHERFASVIPYFSFFGSYFRHIWMLFWVVFWQLAVTADFTPYQIDFVRIHTYITHTRTPKVKFSFIFVVQNSKF